MLKRFNILCSLGSSNLLYLDPMNMHIIKDNIKIQSSISNLVVRLSSYFNAGFCCEYNHLWVVTNESYFPAYEIQDLIKDKL